MPARSIAPANYSAASAMSCINIVSTAICNGQSTGQSHLVAKYREDTFIFYVSNNMFDETKLMIGWPQAQRCSCSTWHSQLTCSQGPNHIEDAVVVRAPI